MNCFAPDSRAAMTVLESSLILKRFHFLQRELVLAQAGWVPGTVHWETKLLLPEILWQDSLIFWELRERVLELRYPERRIERGGDDSFLTLWRRLLRDAPSDAAFARALGGAIKPCLRAWFACYLELADPLDDAPTVRILTHAIDDAGRQIERLQATWDDLADCEDREKTREAEAWKNSVAAVLRRYPPRLMMSSATPEAEPGGELPAASRPFQIARLGKRDPRFSYAKIPWPDSLEPARGPGEGFELQIRQAQAHLNEIWAAEMAAAVLFDLGDLDGVPAEFLKEASRWCFDEVRHCRMGYQRFLHWGFRKGEMPMGSFSYDAGERLDPIVRLGIIFYFESTYIHTKSERTKKFAEFGDRTSSHDMDFDWADELIHTHYGKKWLHYFLEKNADPRTLREIRETAENAVADLRRRATAADRERTEALYRATLRRGRELEEPKEEMKH